MGWLGVAGDDTTLNMIPQGPAHADLSTDLGTDAIGPGFAFPFRGMSTCIRGDAQKPHNMRPRVATLMRSFSPDEVRALSLPSVYQGLIP